MGVITLIRTQSIMQSLIPLLASLAVSQAAGLPALALGSGGVVTNSGLHSSVSSLGHGGLSSGLHHASHGGLHSSVVSHHGSHGGFSGLHNSVVSSHGSHGGLHSSVGSLGHGGIISSGPAYSAPVVTHLPSGYESGHDQYEQPDPFSFEYGVQDDHYHTDFSEHRSGDAEGNIVGDYQVALPDGRVQYVTYRADGHYGGTVMEVKYEGEARHPEVVHAAPVVHEVHDVVHEVVPLPPPSYHGY